MRYPALLILLSFGLAACTNKPPPTSICPKTGFIDNTDTATWLASGSPKDIIARATINGFQGVCSFGKDKQHPEVEVDLTLPFVVQKGAAGGDIKEKELPYFIAVLSPEEKILQRQGFTTQVSFDGNGTGSETEEHVIRIPLKSEDDSPGYSVIVGFALTRDQLKYNEEQKK